MFRATALLAVTTTGVAVEWVPVSELAGHDVTSLASNFVGAVYAGTDGAGVFVSEDAGATWTALNSGLPNLHVTTVAVLLLGPPSPTGCPPLCGPLLVLRAPLARTSGSVLARQ